MLSKSLNSNAPLDLSILPENAEHNACIEALYDESFGPGRFAKTASRLREGNQQLLEHSFVCSVEGRIVGAVRLWPVKIGDKVEGVFVGPVAVAASHQGQQIGLILTEACLSSAKDADWKLAVLIGDADYFGRIGFQEVSSTDLIPPGYVPKGRLLARELQNGALKKASGKLQVPDLSALASPDE
jgi:predicted N-acetyltransferase YhbS